MKPTRKLVPAVLLAFLVAGCEFSSGEPTTAPPIAARQTAIAQAQKKGKVVRKRKEPGLHPSPAATPKDL